MISLKSAVQMGDDVFELVFYCPALEHTFVKLFRDREHVLSNMIAGDAALEIDEALIGWTEAEGRREIDFFARKEPPENYETVTIILDRVLLDRLEKWCAARCITLEQLTVAFLSFIIRPENESWLERFAHASAQETTADEEG